MSEKITEEKVLSPRASNNKSKSVDLAPRGLELEGKSIGLYSNNKSNSADLLRAVADEWGNEFPEVKLGNVVEKAHASNTGNKEGLIQQVSDEHDAVILAMGDCGSCTTYLIYDAIEFEKRGTPTVCLSSSKFIPLSRYDAYHMGCPGLPIVEFEHPIIRMDIDEIKEKRVTGDMIKEISSAYTMTSNDVYNEWSNRYSIDEFEDRPQFDQCTL